MAPLQSGQSDRTLAAAHGKQHARQGQNNQPCLSQQRVRRLGWGKHEPTERLTPMKRISVSLLGLAAMPLTLTTIASAYADTCAVPSPDYATIQAALDDAACDPVRVAPDRP